MHLKGMMNIGELSPKTAINTLTGLALKASTALRKVLASCVLVFEGGILEMRPAVAVEETTPTDATRPMSFQHCELSPS